jgi:hypothetical protein
VCDLHWALHDDGSALLTYSFWTGGLRSRVDISLSTQADVFAEFYVAQALCGEPEMIAKDPVWDFCHPKRLHTMFLHASEHCMQTCQLNLVLVTECLTDAQLSGDQAMCCVLVYLEGGKQLANFSGLHRGKSSMEW